jgi:hypothetical protein
MGAYLSNIAESFCIIQDSLLCLFDSLLSFLYFVLWININIFSFTRFACTCPNICYCQA